MSLIASLGATPRALRLATLEPSKYRRRLTAFLPLGIVLLFGFWASAVIFNSVADDRSTIINLVQIGGLMLPMLIGSTVLILVGEDKDTSMTARTQTFGFTLREIGFSKALWGLAIAVAGIVAVTLSTGAAGASVNLHYPGNYLVIVLFAFAAEIACLVPALLNLGFRKRGQSIVLALSLCGSLLGSAGHFMPRYLAALTPFTFAGSMTPVKITSEGPYDGSYSVLLPLLVLLISAVVTAVSVVFFPKRSSND